MNDKPQPRLRRLATPSSISLFTVLAATGVLMFFHLVEGPAERPVKELHEWLGILFVGASCLHIWTNWRQFKAHLRTRPLWILAILVLGAALTVLGTAGGGGKRRGGGGLRAVLDAVASAPLRDVAPVLGASPDDLRSRLEKAGFTVSGTDASLTEIAQASGKPARAALDAVAPEPQPEPGPRPE